MLITSVLYHASYIYIYQIIKVEKLEIHTLQVIEISESLLVFHLISELAEKTTNAVHSAGRPFSQKRNMLFPSRITDG